jgi:hypothetical protein
MLVPQCACNIPSLLNSPFLWKLQKTVWKYILFCLEVHFLTMFEIVFLKIGRIFRSKKGMKSRVVFPFLF